MVPINCRPGGSEDSYDSDFGDFSFGDEEEAKKNRPVYIKKITPEKELFYTVYDGNLNEMIEKISDLSFQINNRVDYEFSLLHYACRYGHTDIVQYLLDHNANANCEIESITPLMEACNEKHKRYSENSLTIVKLLLDHKAIINVSDKYGKTPIMYACESGYLDIVKLLIPDVSLDTCDNEGKTIIFFAIENNHIEIVKFLIEYGVNTKVFNNKGYKPTDVALTYGFNDIYDLLPKEKVPYQVPHTFLEYSDIHDCIPRIFLKTEIPEYFQEINKILKEINMSKFVDKFAIAKINLSEFLTITDERLEEIGIEYPFQRNQFHLGLLHFHLNCWSKDDIIRVKRCEPDSFEDILLLSGNHLKHLVRINSSIKYVQQNLEANLLDKLKLESVHSLRKSVNKYKDIIISLQYTVKYLRSFTPEKPPLYIEYGDRKKKSNEIKCLLKYSILVGISIIICSQIKKYIFF